jgi:hypothetical protein
MSPEDEAPPRPSDVAMWHLLSGTPDNVTEEGDFVDLDPGLQQRTEKQRLRAAIAELRGAEAPPEVRTLGRLAASYLLAGDAETAWRYVNTAFSLLESNDSQGHV